MTSPITKFKTIIFLTCEQLLTDGLSLDATNPARGTEVAMNLHICKPLKTRIQELGNAGSQSCMVPWPRLLLARLEVRVELTHASNMVRELSNFTHPSISVAASEYIICLEHIYLISAGHTMNSYRPPPRQPPIPERHYGRDYRDEGI